VHALFFSIKHPMTEVWNLVVAPIRRHRGLHYFLRNLFFAPAEKKRAGIAAQLRTARTLPIVMIVGCSRSGTSFTARMLNSAGLMFPGEHTVPDEFNPEGYFEEERVVAINSDILWGSGGHWFMPPAKLRVYAYQRSQIVQTLSWLCSFEGVCGWKDPRGTLTLPVWIDIARELNIPILIVGVFRNPRAVANSIVQHERGLFDFTQALNAWCVHNTRLLDLAASLPDRFYWFTIDQPSTRTEANLNAIAARLGLKGRVALGQSRQIPTETAPVADINEEARTIYDRLLEAHGIQWGGVLSGQSACGAL
jgi:hypothetical protein